MNYLWLSHVNYLWIFACIKVHVLLNKPYAVQVLLIRPIQFLSIFYYSTQVDVLPYAIYSSRNARLHYFY